MSEEMDLGDQRFGIAQSAFALGKGMNKQLDEHWGDGGQHGLN